MLVIDKGESEVEEKHTSIHSHPAMLSGETCGNEGPHSGPPSPGPHLQVAYLVIT